MQRAIRVAHRSVRAAGARRTRLTPLAAALIFGVTGFAQAATIAVNDASDGSAAGKCTLTDAVSALNTASAVSACAAGDGSNDTIDLSFFSSATDLVFALPTSADGKSAIAFTKAVTLRGPLDGSTPRVTIRRSSVSGTPNFRIIASSVDIVVQGVTVSDGVINARGAGIYASGAANLTLTNAIVRNNAIVTAPYGGGGIDVENGAATLNHSTVSGNSAITNGGGIYTPNAGLISVNDSTVSNNSAASGGGVYSFFGSVTLNRSTVSGNNASSVGGGVFARETITMTNTTIANNHAFAFGGGVQTYDGGVKMYFCTVAGNSATYAGGGVEAGDFFYLTSIGSIIRGNTAGAYADVNMQGFLISGSNNIIGSPPPDAPPDTLDCDTKLGSLADNGGPTWTMALFAGSCAREAGPDTLPNSITTDQRGNPRPSGTKSDIGAFESQGPNDPPPDLIFGNGFEP